MSCVYVLPNRLCPLVLRDAFCLAAGGMFKRLMGKVIRACNFYWKMPGLILAEKKTPNVWYFQYKIEKVTFLRECQLIQGQNVSSCDI